jgi:hypothetical protein
MQKMESHHQTCSSSLSFVRLPLQADFTCVLAMCLPGSFNGSKASHNQMREVRTWVSMPRREVLYSKLSVQFSNMFTPRVLFGYYRNQSVSLGFT